MKKLEMFWIATGIILTNATQLRLSGLPIGIGEIISIIWILWKSFQLIIAKNYVITPILKAVCLFWLIGFISLAFGLSIADAMNVKSNYWLHDCFAFIFSFILSIYLVNSDFFELHIHKIIDYVVSFSVLALSIIWLFPSAVPFLNIWYEGVRFIGWSQNSNQLALLLSTIPFFIFYLLKQSKKLLLKLKFICLIFLCFIIGAATQSDALIFGWIVGFGVYILTGVYFFITKNILPKKYINAEIKILAQALIAVVLAIVILNLAEFSYQQLHNTASHVYDEGNQGSLRMTLWKNGIAAIFASPLFGLGSGAHSGITSPFLDFEAHNTFIDWGSSSGIVGIIAYISLIGWVAWQTWKAQSLIMLSAVICLIVFSGFHYVLRHPTFWFYLLSISSLTSQASKNQCRNLI